MSRQVSYLKDELRRTFTIYALIPTFIIGVLFLAMAATYWNANVVEEVSVILNLKATQLEEMLAGAMQKANEIAALNDIAEIRSNKNASTTVYEELYRHANSLGRQNEFYIYDEKFNRLIANKSTDPEFIELARDADWGIIRQIKKNPTFPQFDFVSPINNTGLKMDLVVGKAMLDKGKITGYILFVLPEGQLKSLMYHPNVNLVVKDKYDYVPIYAAEFFCDTLQKMRPEFIDAAGYLALEERKYYVNKRDIVNGDLTVYAVASVGGLVTQLTNSLIMLILLLIILALSIIISVKRQVDAKTKMIDQLVEAFSAVKNGNLDMRLNITTPYEFQLISDAYNIMLDSLKELIRTNNEKARATVISEIKQLESQFNPHFLFNTLENIKYMIKLDPNAASKMIVALSNLLRYSISNSANEVTIQQDIAYTQNYLDIQKYRFGARLSYIIDIPHELSSCLVPKLISQPIIENAIKYGYRDCRQLFIKIQAKLVESRLIISIDNNGAAIDEFTLQKINNMLVATHNYSEHSGLYNVNRRIQLLYGEPYGLEIKSSEQAGTTVKIILPLRKNP